MQYLSLGRKNHCLLFVLTVVWQECKLGSFLCQIQEHSKISGSVASRGANKSKKKVTRDFSKDFVIFEILFKILGILGFFQFFFQDFSKIFGIFEIFSSYLPLVASQK